MIRQGLAAWGVRELDEEAGLLVGSGSGDLHTQGVLPVSPLTVNPSAQQSHRMAECQE